MPWPTSARFQEALRASHEVVTEADVLHDGKVVERGLPITGGSVSVDEGSSVRRTVTLDVGDLDLDPDDAEDLLAPFGTEIAIRSGVRFTEGDTELVPVGVFRLDDVGRGGWFEALTLTGADRSATVSDARFLGPRNTRPNRVVVDEIATLIREAIDVEVFDLTFSTAITAAATWERDRWPAIETLAASIGAEVYFDPAGRALTRPIPEVDPGGEVVWEIDCGENGVLLDVSTGLSRDQVYNAVVARGEASEQSAPVQAIAYQARGRTRWRKGFQVPRFYSSPMIQTISQAETAARKILARSVAFSREIGPTTLPNPALDVGDQVAVTLPDGSRSFHIVTKISLPLGPGSMGIETRVAADYETTTDAGSLA